MMHETVLYLTTIKCDNGHCTTIAHEGQWVPMDACPPQPLVRHCPHCSQPLPDDLSAVITEVSEAVRVKMPELKEERRRAGPDGKTYDPEEVDPADACERCGHVEGKPVQGDAA